MRLKVDAVRCAGHGRCYAMFPDLFDEDDYGHSVAYLDELADADLDDARVAVGNCPEAAIGIEP
jgi:ferredoxin